MPLTVKKDCRILKNNISEFTLKTITAYPGENFQYKMFLVSVQIPE